ncbi:NADH-ubiquinone oxidoreductase chain 4 [Trichinella papuae]|uniref:NADH-ubiquinone oxidoreductase chain 4 n=1 Tax=Trichinella papuae TaxID=268474 RepID=A0A0V1M1N1_9BILA|nr:NADH-ubiquinone oxidoreductase chain 4 [Trichinella papuae]
MVLPFVIKLPVYLFHLWLPKAHVEAPVLGSMILASILLKTGGYGLVKIGGLTVDLGFVGGLARLLLCLSLLSAVTAMLQSDIKKFVAYSSVTHITIVLGLVVLNFGVLDSAIMCLILSHGVLSNSMFFLVGILSNSSKTRLLFKQQGLLQSSPVVWFFLVFLLFMSSGVPPSVGMISEISYVVCCISVCRVNLVLLIVLFVALLYYPLWFVCMMAAGKLSNSLVASSLGLVMFMGAMIAKRAQVPMIHSSTLAVAGCVLCVKLGDCMGVMWVNGLLVVVGLLTRLYASLIAFFELDLKKILAYSTMSQVAMVMLILLRGLYSLMMMHVMNHALVKALLFINIGVMIRKSSSLFGGYVWVDVYVLLLFEGVFVMYSLRVIYVLMGGLSGKVFFNRFGVSFANIQVLIIPVLVMGWFLIMNFSMPCNPGFDVFKALLLITPFVMLLFVLKVWVFPWVINVDLYYEYLNSGIIGLKFFVLSFVKGLHVSGFIPLIGLLNIKRGFEESKILEGDVVWCVFYAVVVIFGFTVNNWLSMWTVLELTTWVAVVIVIEEMNSSEVMFKFYLVSSLSSMVLLYLWFASGSLVNGVGFEECVLGEYVISYGCS